MNDLGKIGIYLNCYYFRHAFYSLLFFFLLLTMPPNYYQDISVIHYLISNAYYFILISICFISLSNLFMLMISFIKNKFVEQKKSDNSLYKLFLCFLLSLCLYNIIPNTQLIANDKSILLNISLILLVCYLIFYLCYSGYSSIESLIQHYKIKPNKIHWIYSTLTEKQTTNSNVLYDSSSLISIYLKKEDLLINFKKNYICKKNEYYKLNSFKEYIDDKKYLINDLNEDDWLIIKMMSI